MKQIILLCGLLLALGCKREISAPPISAATNQTFAARGVVQNIAPDFHHATIKHEKIPGYMAAMTMDFSVKNTNALDNISVGDEITFTLVVTADDDWIENLQRTGKTSTPTPAPTWHVVESELQVGDVLPDYGFTSEAGTPVRFSDFRGRAIAFTFFFTSCPLPEYCPRMNKNFLEARKILTNDTNAPTNWQLLSISFDSDFDTPEILSGYAKFYRGADTNRWLFAVAATNTLASLAPKVDLNFWRANGSISHNLRTVVLDGNGKITRQFDGNDWTPQQLADAIRAAAKIR
ncbi:MAG TPA: copper-binding protein [Verrucomicrobiae bacterium]